MTRQEIAKRYYEKHKKECLERSKQYRETHKEEKKAWSQEYYQEHKDEYNEYQRKYREEHKEELNEKRRKYREIHKDNKDVKREAEKRRLTDPIYKFKHGIRIAISRSFTRCGQKKSERTEQILGCTIEEFRNYIESKFQEGMSFDNYGEWHLDHIKPLALADTKEDVIKLCHYTNFQPLWAEDNLMKGCKVIDN